MKINPNKRRSGTATQPETRNIRRRAIMKKINWETIAGDISEAREELEKIEADVKAGRAPCLEAFQVQLQHVYHHVNFAWNCRYVSTDRYAQMTNTDFKKWSKYSKDVENI
jgi:hypothetical protein